MKLSEVDICYYHDNCPDGILAAYPIWLLNKRVAVIPVGHGKNYDFTICINRNVLIVDFCFNPNDMKKLSMLAKRVFVLDHHKSALENMKTINIGSPATIRDFDDGVTEINTGNIKCHFDMNHSGCYLSFQEFWPGQKNHWLVLGVEDRDLYRIPPKYDYAEAVYRAFTVLDMSFERIDKLFFGNKLHIDDPKVEFGIDLWNYTPKGESMLEYDQSRARDAIKHSSLYKFLHYIVKMTSCDIHVSNIVGNTMACDPGVDFAVMFFYDPVMDIWKLSCRSDPNKNVDLSIICSQFYKGGGHPGAAGFSIYGPRSDIEYVDDGTQFLTGTLRDWFIPI